MSASTNYGHTSIDAVIASASTASAGSTAKIKAPKRITRYSELMSFTFPAVLEDTSAQPSEPVECSTLSNPSDPLPNPVEEQAKSDWAKIKVKQGSYFDPTNQNTRITLKSPEQWKETLRSSLGELLNGTDDPHKKDSFMTDLESFRDDIIKSILLHDEVSHIAKPDCPSLIDEYAAFAVGCAERVSWNILQYEASLRDGLETIGTFGNSLNRDQCEKTGETLDRMLTLYADLTSMVGRKKKRIEKYQDWLNIVSKDGTVVRGPLSENVSDVDRSNGIATGVTEVTEVKSVAAMTDMTDATRAVTRGGTSTEQGQETWVKGTSFLEDVESAEKLRREEREK